MNLNEQKLECYQALLTRNTNFDDVFYIGVKTTGVFCKPSCLAKKPKLENCEFFHRIKEVFLASFRSCKICQPLTFHCELGSEMNKIINAVEGTPERRWNNYFDGNLVKFSPTHKLVGSDFQKRVWHELQQMRLREVLSYTELANRIGLRTACMAVANANGELGVWWRKFIRKRRLINHEQRLCGLSETLE